MAIIYVSSGVTSTGVILNFYDSMFVSSGGTANSTTVYGGKMTVLAKGTANSTTISSGGSMDVKGPGGVANYTMVTINGEFYASSGGTMNHTTVNGFAAVLDSACAANDTTVLYGGRFLVSKGTATSTTVNSGGSVDVRSGGTATSTTVSSGGKMEVSSGGTAAVIREDGGYVDVKSGAVATFVSNTIEDQVFSGTTASLHSGTTANNTQVKYSGKLYVCGGRASNTTVSLEGSIYVSGGAANVNTVNFDGRMYVYSGGTANSTTVNSGGSVDVRSGGTANSTTVNSGGSVDVRSGTVNSTTLYAGGSIALHDGVAKNTVVSSGAYFCIFNDGDIASNTTVCEGGTLRVSHGATVDTATLNAGHMTVSRNGVAKDVLVNSNGELIVQIGGVATGAKVDSGGIMIVSSGGTAKNTTIRSGGMARVYGSVFVSEFVVDGELEVTSGGVMSQGIGLTIEDGGRLTIMDSATVCGAIVKSSASIVVEWKGSFAMAGISGGRVTASDGAILDSVFLNSGSLLEVASRAVIKDVYVSSGAVLTGVLRNATNLTFSGGTLDLNIAKFAMDDACIVDAASFACIKAGTYGCTLTVSNKQENGTYKLIEGATGFNATVTVQNVVGGKLGTITVGGGPTEVLGGVFYDLKLSGNNLVVTVTGGAVPDPVYTGDLINERKDITSGMSALGVDVLSGGELYISSGGEASITTVSSGGLFKVCSKGDTEDTNVESGGTMFIYDDVMAKNVVVNGGVYVIESDGWAYQESKGKLVSSNTIVKNGGTVIVSGGGHCGGVIVSDGGHIIVESDGHLGSAFITSGDVTVKDGVESAGASLLDGGVMVVESGGTAGCIVSSGGVVKVESGGYLRALTVSTGGVVTGVLHDIYTVFSMYGGTLDLDISNAAPGGEFLIDDDANFDPNESFNCTLTVSDMLTNGTYNLMEYAYEFDTKVITAESPLTVKNTGGATLGTLTVGQTASINGANYTLNLSNDHHLTVTISGGAPAPAYTARGDRDGNGVSDVMFVWTGEHGECNHAHGYWMNGTSDWWSANAPGVSPDWDNLGSYDMSGDGKADAVMFGNVIVNDARGAYIGYYQDGNDMDGWVTIGFLDNAENIAWQNKVCNLTGNASGVNSIIWYAPDLYALGAWKDGTTEWVNLSASFGGAEWNLAGCGDFDGDGTDSVLMTYNNGQLYYVVGIDGAAPVALGSADWRGWDLRAIGDFKGDGKDDIVLFHHDTGSMVMCADGNLDSYVSIGQLAANDWFIVGAGDYNGDAKDDLLVRQISTGMLGYYVSGDQSQWVELGRGVDMDWTVIA